MIDVLKEVKDALFWKKVPELERIYNTGDGDLFVSWDWISYNHAIKGYVQKKMNSYINCDRYFDEIENGAKLRIKTTPDR